MVQSDIIKQKHNTPLILLLDDIMSELDNIHRKNITKFLLEKQNQTILTGANNDEIPKLLSKKSKQIKITY